MARARRAEHGLTQIGDGVPIVVKAHDPNCTTCAALQREGRAASRVFSSDELRLLIANLRTASGQSFAAEHDFGRVKLLLFDGKGRRRLTLADMRDAASTAQATSINQRLAGSLSGDASSPPRRAAAPAAARPLHVPFIFLKASVHRRERTVSSRIGIFNLEAATKAARHERRSLKMTSVTQLSPTNLSTAKWAFTTRRVRKSDAVALGDDFASAVPGDLVLAEVLSIRSHKRVQLATGRAATLYKGDRVVLCAGDRYAPDQFEGVCEIDPAGADMIAGGGLLGCMLRKNARIAEPTRLKPIGMLLDAQGETVNVGAYALPSRAHPKNLKVIGVVGASMNSGKTTATASLAHGLQRSGLSVATIKATGTGAFGDYNMYLDTGAAFVGDFTDAGMASTYLQPIDRVIDGLKTLLGHAAAAGCEIALVELADGVFQRETAEILKTPSMRRIFDAFMLATPDALAATGGVTVLGGLGIRPFAISGMVSASPLASAEAVAQTGVAIVSREKLCAPASARALTEAAVGPLAASSTAAAA